MIHARFRIMFSLLLCLCSLCITACGNATIAKRPDVVPTTQATTAPATASPKSTPTPVAVPTQNVPIPTTTPPPVSRFDACTLVTQSEIEAALGESVQKPSSGTTMYGAARCYYNGTTIYSSAAGIELVVGAGATTDYAKHAQDNPQQMAVAGIGDKAFWNDHMLWVLRGQSELSILLLKAHAGTFTTSLDSTEGIAKLALARLPAESLPPLTFDLLGPPVTP